MISIKNQHEIAAMKQAGRVAAAAREAAKAAIHPGVTTAEVDAAVKDAILSRGGIPTFLGYGGFPACACVSLNSEVIHGIPGRKVIHEGDLVKVDVGATVEGFVGDCAATFFCGKVSPEAEKLARVTRESFFEALKYARVGYRLSDISSAVQNYAESYGYGVVRDYVGHGIGKAMHEDPQVPNFGRPGRGPRLVAGMTICVEPMINEGTFEVKVQPDGWTVLTADGKLSAHYENTILITSGDPVILTRDREDI